MSRDASRALFAATVSTGVNSWTAMESEADGVLENRFVGAMSGGEGPPAGAARPAAHDFGPSCGGPRT